MAMTVGYKKTLKLTNVVVAGFNFENIKGSGVVFEQMSNFIKSKGFKPMGPPIHNARNDTGQTRPSYNSNRSNADTGTVPVSADLPVKSSLSHA